MPHALAAERYFSQAVGCHLRHTAEIEVNQPSATARQRPGLQTADSYKTETRPVKRLQTTRTWVMFSAPTSPKRTSYQRPTSFTSKQSSRFSEVMVGIRSANSWTTALVMCW